MELGMSFYRSDNHTIMSGLVVRYKVLSDRIDGEVSASREGVLISRLPHLTNIQEVLDVQRVIGKAYEQYAYLYEGGSPRSFASDPPCVVEWRKYRVMSQDYELLESREYAVWQQEPEKPQPVIVSIETMQRLMAEYGLKQEDFITTDN